MKLTTSIKCKVKDDRSYTSTPPYFVAYTGATISLYFTFTDIIVYDVEVFTFICMISKLFLIRTCLNTRVDVAYAEELTVKLIIFVSAERAVAPSECRIGETIIRFLLQAFLLTNCTAESVGRTDAAINVPLSNLLVRALC